MPVSEKVTELIEGLKSCSDTDIDKYFVPLQYHFSMLPNIEKLNVADHLLIWANKNSIVQPSKLSYVYYIIAIASYFNERHESTLANANEAQKLFDDQNNADGKALCLLLIGATYRTLGNLELALPSLWESYEQLGKLRKYTQGFLSAAYNIAGIYADRKNFDEALPLLEQLLENATHFDNKLFILNACQSIGKIFLVRKEYDAAKDLFEQALAVAEDIHSSIFVSNILTELAAYYTETGNIDKAIELHTEALDLRNSQRMIGGSITNMLSLANIYLAKEDTDEAITILQKALEMAERVKVKPKMYQIHKLLSEIYEKKGITEKSLQHYKLFHELREQVELEDGSRKIKSLQTIFEAEQTKKENIIIKKQKEEIGRKNIELQETIDELTITKVSRKAKALTLVIGITLFIGEDFLLDLVLHKLPENNIILSLGAKLMVVFSLKPIEKAIEHHLLKKAIKKKQHTIIT
jgi:tetratricopeptide (TPR) repeat protein